MSIHSSRWTVIECVKDDEVAERKTNEDVVKRTWKMDWTPKDMNIKT